jgi:hypothetical protein
MANGIGWAIKELTDGRDVRRASWDPGHVIFGIPARIKALHEIDEDSHIGLEVPGEDASFWIPTHEDLLAVDWEGILVPTAASK